MTAAMTTTNESSTEYTKITVENLLRLPLRRDTSRAYDGIVVFHTGRISESTGYPEVGAAGTQGEYAVELLTQFSDAISIQRPKRCENLDAAAEMGLEIPLFMVELCLGSQGTHYYIPGKQNCFEVGASNSTLVVNIV